MTKFSAIILAAGKGTRMKSALPKPLHKLAHKPMLGYVIDAYKAAGAVEIVVVISADDKLTPQLFPGVKTVIQAEQKGTGHATQVGLDGLTQPVDRVISTMGDMPFICVETIEDLANADNTVTVLGMQPADPLRYGRLIVTNDGMLEKIVEFKDATAQQKKITLCNSGTIAFDYKARDLLSAVRTDNAAGEYYLTDIVAIARKRNERCGIVTTLYENAAAANTREELAYLESIIQKRLRQNAMANGATLIDPETVYFSHDTVTGCDVIIEPNVFFGPDVVIGDRVHIKAFSHIEGTIIKNNARIGPFVRMRPDTVIEENAGIGNFVEINRSHIAARTTVNHHSFISNTTIGYDSEIGAGTITCNYNGFDKFRTVIGNKAFIGSNNTLVAPVTIGNGAMTAAGSVITDEVPDDSMGIARNRQENKPGWAKKFREKQQG